MRRKICVKKDDLKVVTENCVKQISKDRFTLNVNFIKNILSNIIDFLKHGNIVNENRIQELKIISQWVHVYINNFVDEYTDYELVLENNEYMSLKLKNNKNSNVIIIPPQIENSKVVKIPPILNIMEFHDYKIITKQLFHEICHLFAISNYSIEQVENRFKIQYNCGIESVYCEYIDGKQNKFKSTQYVFLNEIFNDIVAEYLYINIQKGNYKNYKRKRFNHFIESIKFIKQYIGDDVLLFIKYYLESNLQGIFTFFNKDFKSFKVLNLYLIEKIRK